jgi:hypothetical protein
MSIVHRKTPNAAALPIQARRDPRSLLSAPGRGAPARRAVSPSARAQRSEGGARLGLAAQHGIDGGNRAPSIRGGGLQHCAAAQREVQPRSEMFGGAEEGSSMAQQHSEKCQCNSTVESATRSACVNLLPLVPTLPPPPSRSLITHSLARSPTPSVSCSMSRWHRD